MGQTCSKCCGEDPSKTAMRNDGKKKKSKKNSLVGFDQLMGSPDRSAAVTSLIQNNSIKGSTKTKNSIKDQNINRFSINSKNERHIIYEEKNEGIIEEKNIEEEQCEKSVQSSRRSIHSLQSIRITNPTHILDELSERKLYENIIEESKIDEMFDEVLNNNTLYNKLESPQRIVCKSYDKENGYGFKVEARDYSVKKEKIQEIKHYVSYDPKSFTDKDYM